MITATNGIQIFKGLNSTRKFFENTALLIETAEGLLKKESWTILPISRSQGKVIDNSNNIDSPYYWIPLVVYRFFESVNYENTILFVAVLLDDERKWPGFEEPWITCGLYKFYPDVDASLDAYWAEEALMEQQSPDGKFKYKGPSDIPEEDKEQLECQSIMALPLVAITNTEDLEKKVIEPLLQEV